ncbi:hypothetical protein ACMBCN_01525 [Candidatus Liberibacter asiaticus]|nr:hypothetical protein [Candidatus Liberibacter asiaticus]
MKLFCWKLCYGNIAIKLPFLLLIIYIYIYIYQNSIPIIMSDLQNKSNHFQQHTSSFS